MARLGLIVPKRLASTAVERNAIKRQGREAFRLLAGSLPPCDVVVTYADRGQTSRVPLTGRAVWRREIETLLARLKATAG